MKTYESKNLEKVIESTSKHFDSDDIYIEVRKCFKGGIGHSSPIRVSDIVDDTDFFKKCITIEYQELLKKVYSHRWSLDVSEISICDNKCYIVVKVLE